MLAGSPTPAIPLSCSVPMSPNPVPSLPGSSNSPQTPGATLRNARKQLSLTQTEFGRLLNMNTPLSPSVVCQLETTQTVPDDIVSRCSKVMEVVQDFQRFLDEQEHLPVGEEGDAVQSYLQSGRAAEGEKQLLLDYMEVLKARKTSGKKNARRGPYRKSNSAAKSPTTQHLGMQPTTPTSPFYQQISPVYQPTSPAVYQPTSPAVYQPTPAVYAAGPPMDAAMANMATEMKRLREQNEQLVAENKRLRALVPTSAEEDSSSDSTAISPSTMVSLGGPRVCTPVTAAVSPKILTATANGSHSTY